VIQEINVLTHPIFMKIRSDVLDILYNLTFRVHETINSITVRCCLEQFVWDVIETCKNYEGGKHDLHVNDYATCSLQSQSPFAELQVSRKTGCNFWAYNNWWPYHVAPLHHLK